MTSMLMRSILLLILGTFTYCTSAQEIDTEVLSFASVERLPVAKGCNADLSLEPIALNEELKACLQRYVLQHIGKNYSYPKRARKERVEAKIYVNFVVERDAKVRQVELLRSAESQYAEGSKDELKAAKEIDQEAIRVIKSLQFEEPAIQKGKAVRMAYTVPINVHL